MALLLLSRAGISPTNVTGGAKARGIYREVHLNGPEAETAFPDEIVQEGGQIGTLKSVQKGIIVRYTAEISIGRSLDQLAHKASGRGSAIDFEPCTEHDLAPRQAVASPALNGFFAQPFRDRRAELENGLSRGFVQHDKQASPADTWDVFSG